MAMVKCRECGHKISNEAPTCPHCGAPGFGASATRGTPTAPKKPATIGTLPGLLIIGAVVYGGFKLATSGSTPPAPATVAASKAQPTAAEVKPQAPSMTKDAFVDSFAANGGAWDVSESKDAMSSKTNVVLSTPAQRFGKDKFGRNIKATLLIQCQQNQTGLVVSLSDFISTRAVMVESRIDKKPSQTRQWDISTDYQAVFAPSAIPTIKALESAEMFVVRITPHGESPMDFPFAVSGLSVHLPKVRKACSW